MNDEIENFFPILKFWNRKLVCIEFFIRNESTPGTKTKSVKDRQQMVE